MMDFLFKIASIIFNFHNHFKFQQKLPAKHGVHILDLRSLGKFHEIVPPVQGKWELPQDILGPKLPSLTTRQFCRHSWKPTTEGVDQGWENNKWEKSCEHRGQLLKKILDLRLFWVRIPLPNIHNHLLVWSSLKSLYVDIKAGHTQWKSITKTTSWRLMIISHFQMATLFLWERQRIDIFSPKWLAYRKMLRTASTRKGDSWFEWFEIMDQ